MNWAPTAAATASAARASFFSTFTPRGGWGNARRTSAATTPMAATVAGSTRPGVKGASPKFSTRSASAPPLISARVSASADATTRSIEPSQRGLPGRGSRWTMPMIVRSSCISGSLARPMKIELRQARVQEVPVLRRLMQLYLYDFAAIDDWTIGEDGLYGNV